MCLIAIRIIIGSSNTKSGFKGNANSIDVGIDSSCVFCRSKSNQARVQSSKAVSYCIEDSRRNKKVEVHFRLYGYKSSIHGFCSGCYGTEDTEHSDGLFLGDGSSNGTTTGSGTGQVLGKDHSTASNINHMGIRLSFVVVIDGTNGCQNLIISQIQIADRGLNTSGDGIVLNSCSIDYYDTPSC